jgi:hypothetical protein
MSRNNKAGVVITLLTLQVPHKHMAKQSNIEEKIGEGVQKGALRANELVNDLFGFSNECRRVVSERGGRVVGLNQKKSTTQFSYIA